MQNGIKVSGSSRDESPGPGKETEELTAAGKGGMAMNNNTNTTGRNIWKDGIMGVVTGDALGCPVQFLTREEIAEDPVTGMRGHGTFNLPEGSWTDDSSLTLAALAGIIEKNGPDLNDIMERFVDWLENGEYTPYGFSFDIGTTCMLAIENYEEDSDPLSCGMDSENSCGNGSLMRIMPFVLWHAKKQLSYIGDGENCMDRRSDSAMSDDEVISGIHKASALTHAHMRAKIACGLYYFAAREILKNRSGSLKEVIKAGLDAGFKFYDGLFGNGEDKGGALELSYYDRLRDLEAFGSLGADAIEGSGYVLHALEAAVWSLITTDTFEDALLCAVNLGLDTDTTAAIAGGLAGLYYGYDRIPKEWLEVIKRRIWIEEMCDKMA